MPATQSLDFSRMSKLQLEAYQKVGKPMDILEEVERRLRVIAAGGGIQEDKGDYERLRHIALHGFPPTPPAPGGALQEAQKELWQAQEHVRQACGRMTDVHPALKETKQYDLVLKIIEDIAAAMQAIQRMKL